MNFCVMLFDEFSWRNAGFRSGLLHLLAVLIDAGQKKHFLTFEPMIARNHIGQHHLVSVPDMRRRVRVIDRCSDEKCLRHLCTYCRTRALRATATVATRLWRVTVLRRPQARGYNIRFCRAFLRNADLIGFGV